jgi:hypothetical protein
MRRQQLNCPRLSLDEMVRPNAMLIVDQPNNSKEDGQGGTEDCRSRDEEHDDLHTLDEWSEN